MHGVTHLFQSIELRRNGESKTFDLARPLLHVNPLPPSNAVISKPTIFKHVSRRLVVNSLLFPSKRPHHARQQMRFAKSKLPFKILPLLFPNLPNCRKSPIVFPAFSGFFFLSLCRDSALISRFSSSSLPYFFFYPISRKAVSFAFLF